MNRFKIKQLLGFSLAIITITVLFQNCGPGFQVVQNMNASSLGSNDGLDLPAIDQNPLSDDEWSITPSVQVKQGFDLHVTIKLSKPATKAVSFGYRPVTNANSAAAVAGQNFVDATGMVTIPVGQDKIDVVIPTLAYSEDFIPRNFTVEILQQTKKSADAIIQPVYQKATYKKIVGPGLEIGYCGVATSGKVKCFGGIRGLENLQGGIGVSDQFGSVEIAGLSGAVDIIAGSKRFCALDLASKINCWGANQGYAARLLPKQIDFFPGVQLKKLISYNEFFGTTQRPVQHLCALTAGDEIVCRQILDSSDTLGVTANLGVVKQAAGEGVFVLPNGTLAILYVNPFRLGVVAAVTGVEEIVSLTARLDPYMRIFARSANGAINCVSVDVSTQFPISVDVANITDGVRQVKGTCLTGQVLTANGRVLSYNRNADLTYATTEVYPIGLIKDIAGDCAITKDDSLACNLPISPTVGASGAHIGMSQYPYDLQAFKTTKIKSIVNNCYINVDSRLRCGYNAVPVQGLDELEVTKITKMFDRSGASYCALLKAGTVRCWSDVSPIAREVSGVADATDLDGGGGNLNDGGACAVAAGRVFCWRSGLVATEKPALGPASSISFTGRTCAVGLDGKARCETGQDAAIQELPGVADTKAKVRLTREGALALVLTSDGRVRSFNIAGTTVTENSIYVAALKDITEISAGSLYACALDKNGTVWCWGSNQHGQFGTGTKSLFNEIPGTPNGEVLTPIVAFGGQRATSLFSGRYYTAIIPVSGSNLRMSGTSMLSKQSNVVEPFDYAP